MGQSIAQTTQQPSHFVVGQDKDGLWLAIETHGRGGGIFASRAAALRYAVFETDHRPDAVKVSTRSLLKLPL